MFVGFTETKFFIQDLHQIKIVGTGSENDVGYEGINMEHLLALKEKIPMSFSGEVTKDKKDANLQMEVSSTMKHGKSESTTVAFDTQTIGKEMSYCLRSETRFISYRKNKASGGAVIARGDVAYGGCLEATLRDKDFPLGIFLSTIGLAVMDWHGDLALGWNAKWCEEDKLMINKRGELVVAGGAVIARGDVAYGAAWRLH
nr:translocase of chloroplast 120, chloroplastic-like [Tanacetum cinerariifolium]